MAITSNDIQQQGFGTSRNGYDMQEVDAFLEYVANGLDVLNNELFEARSAGENTVSSDLLKKAEAELAASQNQVKSLEEKLSVKNEDKDAIAEALIIAQRSADAIKKDAIEEGERIIRDAEEKGAELIREAKAERARITDEIDRLDISRSDFVAEYVALLNKFANEADRDFRKLEIDPSPEDVQVSKGEFNPNSNISAQKRSPMRQGQPSSSTDTKQAPDTFKFGEVDDIEIEDID